MSFQVHQLPDGLRVAIDAVPQARSVAVAVWLGVGSHYERPGEAGAAHFLEHMLFKGTRRRSGADLARSMDRIGGEFNATTSREATCYYGWVLPEYWSEALAILAEMVLESRLAAEDVERERQVILEEIRGDEESLETQAMNAFDRTLWGRHPMGRPVAGTLRSVAGLSRDDLVRLQADQYTPDNAVVAIAGPVPPAAAVAAVARAFPAWSGQRRRTLNPSPSGRLGQGQQRREIRRRGDQVHLCLGGPGPGLMDEEVYTAAVLSTILGGGASSRLFQKIREAEGLAYSVYAFQESYRLAGALGVYAAVRPQRADHAAHLIRSEMMALATAAPASEELHRAKVQVRSGLLLSLETVIERANRAGESLVVLGRAVPVDESLARVEAVTAAQVQALAARLWGAGPAVEVALGPTCGSAAAS